MLDSFVATVTSHWGWLALGVGLAIAEMLAPGYFLIWIAAAAFLTGIIAAQLPVGLAAQVVIFVVLAALVLFGARSWLADNPIESADPNMNDRGARLIGETVIVTHAIDGGSGRVKQGDSEWIARGPDAEPGTRMRVSGHDGAILLVEHLH
ncbi:NfeD family protein [Novosphingobium sp. ZN18A2]|uniref:NfeD family protein n=1 Tax=Novosphingobium sp. ZN18A2 TaxID=3079861 RepID=UPI0030CA9320